MMRIVGIENGKEIYSEEIDDEIFDQSLDGLESYMLATHESLPTRNEISLRINRDVISIYWRSKFNDDLYYIAIPDLIERR